MKTVILDAGHGGHDKGATAFGLNEKDIALDITLNTEKFLVKRNSDIEVVLMRVADKAKSLQDRYKAIMDFKPDAFVSFHCNAVLNDPATSWDERKYARGFEVFYRDEYDMPLAKEIYRLLWRSELWTKGRGMKQDIEWLGKRLTVLDSLETPAVLLELGFLTNEADKDILIDNTKKIADLIAHGINNFLTLSEHDHE